MSEYVIEMQHITKSFNGMKANDDVSLSLKKGEIHALLGENGAGKSTLMNILFGLISPDEGRILINGEEKQITDPNAANDLGIGMVHQHFKLVECFTVLDNIILGAESVKGLFLDKASARKKVMDLSDRYHLSIDPDALVSDITVGMQQRTEILKMLYRDNDILIFDEPTAVLTVQEIDELLRIMKNLASEGKSILFISHKMNEILRVADRCSILRKGCYEGTVDVAGATAESLSELMVGRKVSLHAEKTPAKPGETVLSVKDLTIPMAHGKKDAVHKVSMDIHAGEIVTIAGIDGNGQSELIYGITGLMGVSGGQVTLKGQDITKASVRKRTKLGLAHIPEDRLRYGLILTYSLEDNLILQTYYDKRFTGKGAVLKRPAIRQYAEDLIERYDIRSSAGPVTPSGEMSGGNQQKAVIARELDRDPALVIAFQPIRGVDVGAIEQIHKLLIEERDKGRAILLISFELDEVMDMSDRILVMYEGEIAGEFTPENVTVQELGLYMTGARRQERKEAENEG